MLYAAIDIHKQAFQAAVLDAEGGEVVEERFSGDRESLVRWADGWRGRVGAVAIEATTGWRWVWRELVARGFEVRLVEPVEARRPASPDQPSALTTSLREDDDLARLGGDEFALLATLKHQDAAALADMLEQRLAGKGLAISFGWATSPADGEREQLLELADRRLYQRKTRSQEAAGAHPHRGRG